jgi:large-conductance mechanosensitive channel
MNPIQALKGAIRSLKRDRHGNVQYIGALILGLVVSMITILIAELLGGVLSAQMATLYEQFNLTGTVWQGLFTQTQTIATSAIQVAVIGFLIAAFMVVIAIFAGGGRRR